MDEYRAMAIDKKGKLPLLSLACMVGEGKREIRLAWFSRESIHRGTYGVCEFIRTMYLSYNPDRRK